MRNKLVLVLTTLLMMLSSAYAQDTPNSRQARRIFDQAYNQVFGPEGATLRYDVNIIGIYKTNGTIWFKGKKRKFEDAKACSWNDGTTVYTYRKKKREVEIYSAADNKSDKHSRKFQFDPENFEIKLAFIWTTIKISDFQAGGIPDELFRFPQEKFKNYKIVDKR